MIDLSLSTHTRRIGEIVDMVLDARASQDYRAFVLTPADPIPARRIVYDDPNRRHNDYSSARWHQDAPTFARVKRVSNWGWLRRQAQGLTSDALVHPAVGVTFYVRQWRYSGARHLGMNGTGPLYADHQHHDPILIARLSDGRYFADAWADPSVLHDALSRWKNARGYLCDWQDADGMHDPPTCVIGGADWKTIPDMIARRR